MIALTPLLIAAVCVVLIGWKTKHVPVGSIGVYVLIVSVTFFCSTFLWRHWAVNIFVFCPLAFVLAWLGVLIDMRRRR